MQLLFCNHMWYLVAVVCPATELHFAMLVIKGEPGDVYLTCALENARRDVQATAVMFDHDVRVVCAVEALVRTTVVKRTMLSNSLCFYSNLFTLNARSHSIKDQTWFWNWILSWTKCAVPAERNVQQNCARNQRSMELT